MLTACALVSAILSGGCVPVDGAELGTFARDLWLNALAAFLL